MLTFITILKTFKTLLKGLFTGLGLMLVASPFLLFSCILIGILGKLCWMALNYGFNLLF